MVKIQIYMTFTPRRSENLDLHNFTSRRGEKSDFHHAVVKSQIFTMLW